MLDSTVRASAAAESAVERRPRRHGHAGVRRCSSLLVAVLCAVGLAAAYVTAPALAAGSPGSSDQVQTTPSLGFGSGASTSTASTNTNTIQVPNKATTTASTTGGSSSFSTTDGIVIGILVVIVFCSICGYIWWDSRRRAPKGGHDPDWELEHGSRSGSKSQHRSRKLSPAERKRRKRGQAPTKRRK